MGIKMGEWGILFVVVSIICYFGGKSYATKLYQTTGYYAYGALNLFLAVVAAFAIGVAVMTPSFVMSGTSGVGPRSSGGSVGEAIVFTILALIIAAIPLIILIKRNRKLKKTSTIIMMTIIQMLAGIIAFLGLFAIFALRMAGRDVGGIGGGAPSPSTKINNIEATDRARQQQAQQAYQQEQYQKGFDAGRESTPYDSMPGGLSQEAQDGYQDGQRR